MIARLTRKCVFVNLSKILYVTVNCVLNGPTYVCIASYILLPIPKVAPHVLDV